MKNNHEQFPPLSSNGTGQKHQAKRNGSKQSTEGVTQESERPKQAEHANITSRHRTEERTRPTVKPEHKEDLKPAQILSARVSAYIAKYPIQTIGGLLAVLLVVVLFKTFYQSKNWKAKRMAEEAYFVANQYARNNGTNLHPYLSQAFRKEVRQLPGLLPLSMQTATRGGTITGAESVGLREVTTDSVVVEVALRYENGREEKRYQPLVYEKEQWRLGLTYSR